jgi:hypothetical protein
MSKNWNDEVSRSVVELEFLKKSIIKSQSQEEFEKHMDIAISNSYKVLLKLVSRRNELFSVVQRNIEHLKELRNNNFMPQANGQFDALKHQAGMALGVLQFSFWEKSNQELFQLLEKVEHTH